MSSLPFSPRTRAGVVLIEGGRIALIERVRGAELYYVLPGGMVDEGESCQQAARREAYEELGLDVEIGPLVAEVTVRRSTGDSTQRYYVARAVGGVFGTGTGEEFAGGGYRAVWLTREACGLADVRPRDVVTAIVGRGVDELVRSPLSVLEQKD